MTLIWTFLALLLCGMLELILGTSGFYVPLLLLGMFYFGAFRHWRFALLAGMFIGSAVEMSYGRAVPMCLILMPLLTAASKFWRWMGILNGLGEIAVLFFIEVILLLVGIGAAEHAPFFRHNRISPVRSLHRKLQRPQSHRSC